MKNHMKVLVAGCGVISCHWFEYTVARDDCEIAGVVDKNLNAAESAKKRYGLKCPVFTEIDEALETVKPDIVYDLSYVTTHRDITVKCLEAGCHVFGEKPMTIDRESALEMLSKAKSSGKEYFVMQNRRYQRPMQILRELVRDGRLGNLWMVSADIFVPADLKSIRNTLDSPMLQDNAIHTFDGARFIIGAEPVSVYCHSYNPAESKYKGNAAGVCIFEMSDGSVFVYNCVMGAEGCHTSWESSWRIIGSRGSAVWDGTNPPYAEIPQKDSSTGEMEHITFETPKEQKTQHQGCLEEMWNALLNGKKSQTDCRDNYKSMSMVFSSLESARTGRKVWI